MDDEVASRRKRSGAAESRVPKASLHGTTIIEPRNIQRHSSSIVPYGWALALILLSLDIQARVGSALALLPPHNASRYCGTSNKTTDSTL